jgi:hypothetical protein
MEQGPHLGLYISIFQLLIWVFPKLCGSEELTTRVPMPLAGAPVRLYLDA